MATRQSSETDAETRAGTPSSIYDEIFLTDRRSSTSSSAMGDSGLLINQRFTELSTEDENDTTVNANIVQRASSTCTNASLRSISGSSSVIADSPPPAPTTESPVATHAPRMTSPILSSRPDHQTAASAPADAEPVAALPAPAPAISDAHRVSRGSRRRRESAHGGGSHRGQIGLLPRNVLAALSSQSTEGSGHLLPSLYGTLSSEPAPTYTRPFSSNRLGQPHSLRAQPTTETSPVSATGDSDRTLRNDAAYAERILSGGPSISNAQPPGDILMTPVASARSLQARLCDTEQTHSLLFAPGALSDRGIAQRHADDVRKTCRFEENSIVAFVWTVDGVKQLKSDIESGSSGNPAWKVHPLFGEERWRVEFVRDGGFGVMLSCLALNALPFEARMSTQVTFALRAPRTPGAFVGETLWSETSDHVFYAQNEIITQRVPLDKAFAHAAVGEQDALEIVVQVAAGPALSSPRAFETRNTVAVPKALAGALASMVDDSNTGDVMVIVREKGIQQKPSAELAESVGLKSFVQPWQTGTAAPVPNAEELPVYVRDRVLWAHTPVLRARSDFFATMLDSSFSEGTHIEPSVRSRDSRRPFRVLRIPDADYVTVYWLLRFLYTDEVQFMHNEDIRAVALDDHWILAQGPGDARPDWRWHRVSDEGEAELLRTPQKQPLQPGASVPMMLGESGSSHALEVISDAQSPIIDHSPAVLGSRSSKDASNGVQTMSSDPHPHPPMFAVPPASALALYRIAHRYGITELCDAATAHIIAHLTPDNATNYLLCTTLFQELQSAVQRYIYEHWSEVSASAAFERCCDEVSAGEWGLSAGRSLVALMRNMPHRGR
ncbi:hypothetical protein MCUN1_002067 [Malassezia cuniculi]|uniref:BTB domain-containing protein n=1 Tax=Malassezia cuniculi TaxID=948313 RepID=A0AAF0J669_9BASI|nr:hypothetical protein MCUN1_002067 [Malassezia cuniculi]